MKISIEEIEKLRIKAKNTILIGIIITIIVTIILYLTIGPQQILIFTVMIGIVITFLISQKPTRNFNLSFKNTFVTNALEKAFTDINYKPEMGLDRAIIADTEMMYMGDRYDSNDYLSAKYKDVPLQQADVHIEEEKQRTDSDGNTDTYYVTLFQGKWMIFEFNKAFKSDIQVCQKRFSNAKRNNWFKEEKFKKVELEDMEFNKQFKCYARNEHDAFYVLTPPIIEALKKLGNNKKESILLCFINNQLHVGLENGKDSFEHSIFKKINPLEIEKQLLEEVAKITQFVDALNINRDIFGKEVL